MRTSDSARHRLLEGFVLRLLRRDDADAFVLRGGMLVRQWFPSLARAALDLDLACLLPFDVEDVSRRLREVIGDSTVSDGVFFHPDRHRFDPIWLETAHPGLRMIALGRADGTLAEIQVDVTFGLPLRPERRLFQVERGSGPLLTAPPESIVGRKLQVIVGRGPRHWRPKDLNDIRLVLSSIPLSERTLGDAIEGALVGCDQELGELRDAFSSPLFWGEPLARARWQRFLYETDSEAPDDPAAAAGEVHSYLRALLETR